jgi:antitoxin component of MazEF toxin-antitoxin module
VYPSSETEDIQSLPGTVFAVQSTRVFKAGNSLAMRISSRIARQMGIRDGSDVEMTVGQGVISVRKAPPQELANLIERITPENLQQPIFDDLTGEESW